MIITNYSSGIDTKTLLVARSATTKTYLLPNEIVNKFCEFARVVVNVIC